MNLKRSAERNTIPRTLFAEERSGRVLEESGEEVVVQSAFVLAPEDRQRLTATIRELTRTPDTVIQHHESLDLINGTEQLNLKTRRGTIEQ
jgi:hypothetical protein